MESMEFETWLIDLGDLIIHKKSEHGYETLLPIEKAIYCLWVIDYAVRNSGTLEPMRELHPSSLAELSVYSSQNDFKNLLSFIKLSSNEVEFCDKYYEYFDGICNELKLLYERT